MNYQEALDYIYSFANFETRPAHQLRRADYTLDRIRTLLAALGDPHHAYPTVHITGTKGKGSTAAMIASILQAAGYRVGLFTSPHLHTYRERVRVNGELIREEEVVAWVVAHRELLKTFEGLTTFEVTTALAFETFACKEVDVAVIEVGLGGRVDTTNVITPLVAVITPISLDHTTVLGSTVAEIAADKAGIIKPGVPVVTAPQSLEALAVIQDVAHRLGVPLIEVGRDWTWEAVASGLHGQRFHVRCMGIWEMSPAGSRDLLKEARLSTEVMWKPWLTELRELQLPLLGAHQLVNATTAVATTEVLRHRGFRVPPEAVYRGLRSVQWPGRFEVLAERPRIVVDGAHNSASAWEVLRSVRALFGSPRTILVFGASVDKDVAGMLDVWLPLVDEIILTRARHPRAAAPEALAATVEAQGGGARVVPTVSEALAAAIELARATDLILVTGSLFVVAEAREAWFESQGMPLPPRDPPK